MKILVDEHIPLTTVAMLRGAGHDVLDIRGTADQGADDTKLWEIARREERLLITTDKGFAQNRHDPHHGILIVKLRQPNRDRIHRRVLEGIALVRHKDWAGLLITMRDRFHSIWRAGPNG